MADRVRWWVIPGALVVLLRVVTLPEAAVEPRSAAAPANVTDEQSAALGPVIVRDAVGQRRLGSPGLAAAQNLVLTTPTSAAGQRGVMTIWRRLEGHREGQPWLTLRPRVRADATLPIAGLPAGRYDLEFELGLGADTLRLYAHDAEVPGCALLQRL